MTSLIYESRDDKRRELYFQIRGQAERSLQELSSLDSKTKRVVREVKYFFFAEAGALIGILSPAEL
jgi:hypothetical protein